MDFDPSAFLSMAMTEDQDSVYTAPDVPQGFSPVKAPEGNIVVEGGLQMEQNMQIPVPVFGLLQQDDHMEDEDEANGNQISLGEAPISIDITEPETNTTPQPSPGERAASPYTKKIIHATLEETRFRKDLYCGHYERVKMFRLHCSICDKHIGCAPWYNERYMRLHKLLSVAVCRKCFEFYGDINFPIDKDSEIYCCWCGEGGDCFLCNTCPKIVCKKCLRRNFGPSKIKEIEKNEDWSCFVCKPEDIWPHRALMWGLQRWSKGMRQLVALLPREEKRAKLSLDTSHCCLKSNEGFTSVGLPQKTVLSKIPLSLIALPYQANVREVLARQESFTSTSNGMYVPSNIVKNPINRGVPQVNNLPPRIPETVTRFPRNFAAQTQAPSPSFGYHVRQQVQHVVHRNVMMVSRSAPYPINRNMPPILRPLPPPQPPQYPQRMVVQAQHLLPYNMRPSLGMNSSSQRSEIIDLERESILQQTLQSTLLDTSSLENGVREVKEALRPTLLMLDQFNVIKNELANDFSKLMSYSERLTYNIKIAICNLAKANADLMESQKQIVDNRVTTVVNNIQSTVHNNIHSGNKNNIAVPAVNEKFNLIIQNGVESSPKGSNPHLIIDSSPEIIEMNPNNGSKTPDPKTTSSIRVEQTTPATPSSSTTEEVEDVTIAMLCETVLEVEENKENKDDANKDQTPAKEPQIKINKNVKGKPHSIKNLRKRPHDQISSSTVQIIDLVDDEEEEKEKLNETYYCKKFKIIPCKVVLEKLEILKVDVV